MLNSKKRNYFHNNYTNLIVVCIIVCVKGEKMKVNGTIITIRLDLKTELEEMCPNISFVDMSNFESIRYFTKSELICAIIDVDKLTEEEFEHKIKKYLSDVTKIYVSYSFDKVLEFDSSGKVVLKNSSIISNKILDIYTKRAKLSKLDYLFDYQTRTVLHGKDYYKLRNTPFLIFNYLVTNKGKTCTREELIEATTSKSSLSDSRTVDVHINYLRKKMGDKRIKTVVNEGYKFEDK